jgi:hypothetical protein
MDAAPAVLAAVTAATAAAAALTYSGMAAESVRKDIISG